MEKFKNHLIVAAVFGALALTGTIMNSRSNALQAAGGPTVTIDPAQLPLHVTLSGPASIAGTVAATQSGLWNVGILGNVAATQSGLWNVGILGNVVTRDIGNTTGHPFQLLADEEFSSTSALQFAQGTNTSGKRMVIENAAFFVQIRSPGTVTAALMSISVAGPPDSSSAELVFPNVTNFPDGGGPTFSDYAGSAPVKLYLEPGGEVLLKIVQTGAGGQANGNLHLILNGFLVDP